MNENIDILGIATHISMTSDNGWLYNIYYYYIILLYYALIFIKHSPKAFG